MKKLLIVLIAILLLCFTACTLNKDDNYASADVLLSDNILEERTLYLFDAFVLPIYWWAGAGSSLLDVNVYVEPLSDTPEGTAFYPVNRFDSIEEMKRATEQVVTKKYAQENLYPFLEKHHQFLERNNRLYINTNAGCGAPPFEPISASVNSKTENSAIITVVFRDNLNREETHKIELIKENDNWKLNSFPFLS